MQSSASVLIIDDDPAHLKIYGWIIEAAGYRALPAQARLQGIELPPGPVDLVLLDYHLSARISAVQVAELVREKLPGSPIFLLSDAYTLPEDIAPFVDGFVRKGDPARLVETVNKVLGNLPSPNPK